jgi:predicted enzyme related to lactoylglutathione lyase
MVGLETDGIDTEFTRLKRNGVELIEEPAEPGPAGVRVATFKDPEGNLVQLLQSSGPV